MWLPLLLLLLLLPGGVTGSAERETEHRPTKRNCAEQRKMAGCTETKGQCEANRIRATRREQTGTEGSYAAAPLFVAQSACATRAGLCNTTHFSAVRFLQCSMRACKRVRQSEEQHAVCAAFCLAVLAVGPQWPLFRQSLHPLRADPLLRGSESLTPACLRLFLCWIRSAHSAL
jgi:hypothetical protein